MIRYCVSLFGPVIITLTWSLIGCAPARTAPLRELPKESYERPAEAPHDKSDYVFRLNQMPSFYDAPGEFGHYMGGTEYGFESLYFIITETHPCGGPPLHTHDSEEAHVLIEGTANYVLGNKRLTAEGPYIARVPARLPHTFVNTGTGPFRLVAVFSGDKPPTYHRVDDNPLVKPCSHN